MRGKASVPVRLGRMEEQQAHRSSGRTITILAEEYGLDPGAVRHELKTIERRIRRSGPVPGEVRLQQLATEFDVDPEEIRAEAALIHTRLTARGVAR